MFELKYVIFILSMLLIDQFRVGGSCSYQTICWPPHPTVGREQTCDKEPGAEKDDLWCSLQSICNHILYIWPHVLYVTIFK